MSNQWYIQKILRVKIVLMFCAQFKMLILPSTAIHFFYRCIWEFGCSTRQSQQVDHFLYSGQLCVWQCTWNCKEKLGCDRCKIKLILMFFSFLTDIVECFIISTASKLFIRKGRDEKWLAFEVGKLHVRINYFTWLTDQIHGGKSIGKESGSNNLNELPSSFQKIYFLRL